MGLETATRRSSAHPRSIGAARLIALAAMLAEAAGLPLIHPLLHMRGPSVAAVCDDGCEPAVASGPSEANLTDCRDAAPALRDSDWCPVCRYTQTHPRRLAAPAPAAREQAEPVLAAARAVPAPSAWRTLPSCGPRAPPAGFPCTCL